MDDGADVDNDNMIVVVVEIGFDHPCAVVGVRLVE